MPATDPPITMPLRVTRNETIADGINLLEFRSPQGEPLTGVFRRRTHRCSRAERPAAQIFAVQ